MRRNRKLQLLILPVLLAILSFIHAQFYAAQEKIFITDRLFITPKTQPILYVILIFAGVGLLLFGSYLGNLIALFLFKKGIIFQTVGILLLLATAVFTVLTITGHNIEKNSDYIISGILILFLGTLGVLMTFANKIGKRNK